MIQKKTIVLIVSDVHLGASKIEDRLFENFLDEILKDLKGKYKDLKAFIINGDFFDIIMMDYDEITTTYSYIFDLIEKIREKEIKIILTLGNHEIHVLGRINHNFIKHKIDLIQNFNNASFNYKFLNKDNVWQYILLRQNKYKDVELLLFDSIHDLRTKKIDQIKTLTIINSGLEKEQLAIKSDDFQCFITHGHQFEPNLYRNIAGFFAWSPFIKIRSDALKSGMDLFWNYVAHGRREVSGLINGDIDRLFNELFNEFDIPSHLKRDLKKYLKKIHLKKYLKKILKWEVRRNKNKNKRHFKEISHFFKLKKFHSFNDKITHIIFGHSHKPEKKFQGGPSSCIQVINSGGWQKILKPSFVEVNLEGKNKLKVNLKRFKLTKDLRLLIMFLTCLNYLIGEAIMILLKDNPRKYKTILSFSTDTIFKKALNQDIISNDQFKFLEKYSQPHIKAIPTIKKDAQPQIEDIEKIKNILKTIQGRENQFLA